MEIINSDTIEVTQDKRFYFPAIIKDTCPKCQQEIVKDFSKSEYLAYTPTNKPFFFNFYCEECEHEWTSLKQIILRVKLEEVK